MEYEGSDINDNTEVQTNKIEINGEELERVTYLRKQNNILPAENHSTRSYIP